jgi:hypothetical protein
MGDHPAWPGGMIQPMPSQKHKSNLATSSNKSNLPFFRGTEQSAEKTQLLNQSDPH